MGQWAKLEYRPEVVVFRTVMSMLNFLNFITTIATEENISVLRKDILQKEEMQGMGDASYSQIDAGVLICGAKE